MAVSKVHPIVHNEKRTNAKKIVMYVLPVVLLIVGGVAYMTVAEGDPSGLSTQDKTFLLEAADARMMDWAEGNLAIEKGTTQKHKRYGQRIMHDQTMLMTELKAIATAKNLTMPEKISDEKSQGLKYLKASGGVTFDRRFRRMIISDHKRDIHEFKKAAESTDPEISAFAKKHLPLLEQHLEQARALNQ